jgi:hypothetical protein
MFCLIRARKGFYAAFTVRSVTKQSEAKCIFRGWTISRCISSEANDAWLMTRFTRDGSPFLGSPSTIMHLQPSCHAHRRPRLNAPEFPFGTTSSSVSNADLSMYGTLAPMRISIWSHMSKQAGTKQNRPALVMATLFPTLATMTCWMMVCSGVLLPDIAVEGTSTCLRRYGHWFRVVEIWFAIASYIAV